MAKYDEFSFKKAFAAARSELGKGGTFTWKGKSYSTRLADEPAKVAKKDVAPKTSVRPRAKPPAGDAMKGYRKGDITTASLDNTRPTGRGDGSLELIRRTAEKALAKPVNSTKPQGGLSDRRSSGPSVSSVAPRQGTAPTTPGIKIVRTRTNPAGMAKPKPPTGADLSNPQKRKEYAAAMAAYNRSLKG